MAHSILGSWSCNPKAKSGVGGPRPWGADHPRPVHGHYRKLSRINDIDPILRLDAERPDSYTPRASLTEFRGDRCVRHFRQVTIRPMPKNS
jgi:hypothetical protein